MTEEEYVDTRMSEMQQFCSENNRRLTLHSKELLQQVFKNEFSGNAEKEDCKALLDRVQREIQRRSYAKSSRNYTKEHFSLRCMTDGETAEKVKRYAMYKGLSISSLILQLLNEAMEKDGWE